MSILNGQEVKTLIEAVRVLTDCGDKTRCDLGKLDPLRITESLEGG